MTTVKGVLHQGLRELSLEELHKVYLERQVNFGRAALALNQRRRQNRLHVPAEEADPNTTKTLA